MENKTRLKQELLKTIGDLKTSTDVRLGSPITDVQLDKKIVAEIDRLTQKLEAQNPHLFPLRYAIDLLDGVWQLQY